MISFEKLAPNWDASFKEWDTYNKNTKAALKYDLFIENKCVVAESYGWKDNYARDGDILFCKECRYFSAAFPYCINGEDHILDLEMLERKKQEYVDHVKTMHQLLSP